MTGAALFSKRTVVPMKLTEKQKNQLERRLQKREALRRIIEAGKPKGSDPHEKNRRDTRQNHRGKNPN